MLALNFTYLAVLLCSVSSICCAGESKKEEKPAVAKSTVAAELPVTEKKVNFYSSNFKTLGQVTGKNFFKFLSEPQVKADDKKKDDSKKEDKKEDTKKDDTKKEESPLEPTIYAFESKKDNKYYFKFLSNFAVKITSFTIKHDSKNVIEKLKPISNSFTKDYSHEITLPQILVVSLKDPKDKNFGELPAKAITFKDNAYSFDVPELNKFLEIVKAKFDGDCVVMLVSSVDVALGTIVSITALAEFPVVKDDKSVWDYSAEFIKDFHKGVSGGSKKKLLIIVSIVAAVVIIAAIVIVMVMKSSSGNESGKGSV